MCHPRCAYIIRDTVTVPSQHPEEHNERACDKHNLKFTVFVRLSINDGNENEQNLLMPNRQRISIIILFLHLLDIRDNFKSAENNEDDANLSVETRFS